MKINHIILSFLFILLLVGMASLASAQAYWIDSNSNLWVNTSIPAGINTTTLYIQKTAGYTPNGTQVFDFFDDFNLTTIDSTKWTSMGSVTESSSLLRCLGANAWGGVTSKTSFNTNNYIVMGRTDMELSGSNGYNCYTHK